MKYKKRNNYIKRGLAILCALAMIASILLIAVSQVSAEVTKEDLAKETQEAQKKVEEAKKAVAAIEKEIEAIDSEISSVQDEINQIERNIQQTQEDISIKEQELAQAEVDYENYRKLFLTRARVMYENSNIKYVEILFGAKNFSDFLSKLEMVTMLMEYDRTVLVKLNDAIKKIESAKKELEDILKRQEENLTNLEQRSAYLDSKSAEKQKKLAEAEKNLETSEALYKATKEKEESFVKQHAAAFEEASNPVKATGIYTWPVPQSRRITSRFGTRIHPVYKTKRFHSGIDIGAGQGLDIVAASDGVVTLAATKGGYGKCVVINHGSGITTLYGHCSSLLVSQGQKVTKGDRIAKVGSTGVSTGPHLHFEVRKNGTAVDPLGYVTP